MHKSIITFISLILLCGYTSAKPNVWKIHSHKPVYSVLYKNFKKYIVGPVNAKYPNEFKIELVTDRENSSKNHGSFSATKYGTRQGHFSATMYWGNADPVFAIIGDLIAAWSSSDDLDKWIKSSKAKKLIQDTYSKYNMHFINYSLGPHESLISTSPIRSLKDIKGRIIRVPPGSMAEDFFKEVGAITRPLPLGKVSIALKKKRVHLADFSTVGVNHSEGLYENAKHTNYPGFHSLPMFEFVVNKEQWNELPEKIKKLINKQSDIWRIENTRSLKQQSKAVVKQLKASKIKVYTWSETDIKEARKKASIIWNKYKEKSPEAKALIESIEKWLKDNNRL